MVKKIPSKADTVSVQRFKCFQAPNMVSLEKSLNGWLETNPYVFNVNVTMGVADNMFGAILHYSDLVETKEPVSN